MERIERVRLAIGTMDAGPRAVLERVAAGRDYAAIAGELGITVDEVEREFARALAHIDRSLGRGA